MLLMSSAFPLGRCIEFIESIDDVPQKELENAETPENIEAQARQQLRLIKPGEVLYMFPSEITDRDDSSTGGQKGDSSQ